MGIFWQLLLLLHAPGFAAPHGAPTSPLLAPSIPGGLSHDPSNKKPSCLYPCSSLQVEKPRLGVSPPWVSPGVTRCPCLSLLGLSLPLCLALPCCVFLPSFARACQAGREKKKKNAARA